jgi:hypothetical protein
MQHEKTDLLFEPLDSILSWTMKPRLERAFLEAVYSRETVAGLTHNFYRYPARFSPQFAKAAIETFSNPGDTVVDPFMGGGTTLVEARVLGRRAIGIDINALAAFISTAKTTLYNSSVLTEVMRWAQDTASQTNLHHVTKPNAQLTQQGYPRHLNDQPTWPIRKFIQLALEKIEELRGTQQLLARCILLRTAQWALDCRTHIPSSQLFRKQLIAYAAELTVGAREYAEAVRNADREWNIKGKPKAVVLHRSAIGIENDSIVGKLRPPKLILTSPPYPGVHVLYHRWQIEGRRETAAPFWITRSPDGRGASYYTLGDRKQQELSSYYQQALAAFRSLANIADDHTLVVQMVAFSDPTWQLTRYLETMEQAGFEEKTISSFGSSSDGRLWRDIPNRKWYAVGERARATSKEVVLFHKLR